MRTFNWNDIRAFLAVIRTGSTLAAAPNLKISQTTVARRIDALEKALGTDLFERRNEGYRPTPAAKSLMAEAVRMENAANDLVANLSALQRKANRTLRITTTEIMASLVIAPLIGELRQEQPGLTLEMLADDRKLDLNKGEADLALRIGSRPLDESLIGRRLANSVWAPYCSVEYAARHGVPRTIDDLPGHQLIAGSGQMADNSALAWFLKLAAAVNISTRCNSLPNLVASVRAGIGISVLPCFVAHGDSSLLRCLGKEVRHVSEIWLLYPATKRNDPNLRIVIDAVSSRMAKLRPRFEGEAVP